MLPQKIINKILEIVKWPLAAGVLLSIPALLRAFESFNFYQMKFMAMLAGFIAFFFIRTFADRSMTVTMQTLAHEFTHAFFAMLTFHRVKHIHLNREDDGGGMAFMGGGNWLITVSPYFFPLFIFFFIIGVGIYLQFAPMNLVISGILGYLSGYHLDTVSSQFHEEQPDLHKAGIGFVWTFLPGANLWVIGNVLAFNSRTFEGLLAYNKLIWDLNVSHLKYGINILTGI